MTDAVENPPVVEPTTSTETPAVDAPASETPEMAILSPDPQVVESNLEKAQPVSADVIEPATDAPAPAETAAPAEETAPETAAAAPEKKEGSTILGFLKKHVPNPKTSSDKKPAAVASTSEAPAKTETPEAVVEDDKPFEGDYVDFKTHGGFFGGGWKRRMLKFGVEDGYSTGALAAYIGTHKINAMSVSTEKANGYWDNAAHASVTGVGLLFVTKTSSLDIPINIINLGDVSEVAVHNGHFTVKTGLMGDYEFNVATPDRAQRWKKEIELRVEQSKLTRAGVQEKDTYKESYAHFKDLRGHSKSEAVTSDEEGAVSGEEGKRPSKWTRRISGSFQKITGSSKDAAPEVKKEASAEPPAATETAVVEPAVVAAAVVEPAVVAESSEPAPEMDKKEKRKSFSGFAQNLFKGKADKKEASPEPAMETTEEAVVTETVVDTTTPAPVEETPATTEETPAPETKTEKPNKRGSIFAGLLPKKDKTPMTNGDASESTPAPAVVEPASTETADAPAEDAEYKPPTPKKDTLTRRLTSGFKSLGRSKSPEKGKAAKVSDEAPKIDTPIESTPAATEETPAAAPAPETKTEEPLSTTEVPSGAVDSSSNQAEPTPVPFVSTQA